MTGFISRKLPSEGGFEWDEIIFLEDANAKYQDPLADSEFTKVADLRAENGLPSQKERWRMFRKRNGMPPLSGDAEDYLQTDIIDHYFSDEIKKNIYTKKKEREKNKDQLMLGVFFR